MVGLYAGPHGWGIGRCFSPNGVVFDETPALRGDQSLHEHGTSMGGCLMKEELLFRSHHRDVSKLK